MTRKIKLTKTAQLRLDQLFGYLEEEWSESQTGFHRKTR